MPRHDTLQLVRVRPSLLSRIRSSWSGPLTLNSPEIARVFGAASTASSGISVSESTALAYAAVWCAVNLISGDIASLPLMLYRKLPNGGKDKFDSHPLYRLIHDQPNAEMTSITFRRTLQAHAMTWGNGFAEIELNGAGRPAALWPLMPNTVTPFRERDGRLRYRVPKESGGETLFEPDELLHIPGLGFDGITGYSVIQKARESVGLGVAAERFGGTFFGNGATFGGAFEHPSKMSATAQKNFKESISSAHTGVDQAHKFIVVEEGMKYVRLGIPPDDAQFLETRQFQVLEIARWFNLPPHKLAHLADATFSNVEQQNTDYLVSCLRPWLETWEQELVRKLISPLERTQQDIEHITEGFLRADSAGRAALETAHFRIGGVMPNEVRAAENRNPVKGGDRVFVPVDMMPLDRLDEWIDAQIEAKKPPKPAPPPVDPTAQQKDDTIASQARKIQELTDERDLLKLALDEARVDAKAEHDEAVASGVVLAERDEIIIQNAREIALLTEARDVARADHQRVVAERGVALAAQGVLAADLDGARNDLTAIREQLGVVGAARLSAEGEAAGLRQRAEAAERDRDIAVQAQAAANDLLEQTRQREVTRLTSVITAHRGLMAHTMTRLVTREAENARRHKATPQKLRAWMATFYDGHAEMIADNVLPILRAHLAWMQSDDDPLRLARALAETHISESRRQIEDVLLVEDFTGALERLLMRWEQHRPDVEADAFVREGVAYVRSYQ